MEIWFTAQFNYRRVDLSLVQGQAISGKNLEYFAERCHFKMICQPLSGSCSGEGNAIFVRKHLTRECLENAMNIMGNCQNFVPAWKADVTTIPINQFRDDVRQNLSKILATFIWLPQEQQLM